VNHIQKKPEKNPENKVRFRGVNQHRDPHGSCRFTFFYPDYTVGSGIPPDHAAFCGACFSTEKLSLPKEARGLYHRSGIAPCPEGY
jgi:hypothetical protein